MTEPNIELDKDGNFVVGESTLLNYLTIVICFAIFIGVLITRNFERENSHVFFWFIYLGILMPAIISISKLKRNRSIIIINGNGIYYHNNLVTDWTNFSNAYIAEETPTVSTYSAGLSDKFRIMIVYFDPNKSANYIYKMEMTESQNRSEEQIMSAIQFFSDKALSNDVYKI